MSHHYSEKLEFFDLAGNPCTQERWSELNKSKDRIIGRYDVPPFLVSTVWLGIDHGVGNSDPVLWETMIFVDEPGMADLDQRCRRYTSASHALLVHNALVEAVKRQDWDECYRLLG